MELPGVPAGGRVGGLDGVLSGPWFNLRLQQRRADRPALISSGNELGCLALHAQEHEGDSVAGRSGRSGDAERRLWVDASGGSKYGSREPDGLAFPDESRLPTSHDGRDRCAAVKSMRARSAGADAVACGFVE